MGAMAAVVLHLMVYALWTIMLSASVILLGVVIADIVSKTVEDVL